MPGGELSPELALDFSVRDIDTDLQLRGDYERKERTNVLEDMVDTDELERVGSRRGWYRRVDRRLDIIDWRNAPTEEFSISWPFQIEDKVKIFPKSIVTIAGTQNSGKTAFCLNVVRLNQSRPGFPPIFYFSSEMQETEMRIRLQAFDLPLDDWNFTPVLRTGDFEDVIQPDAMFYHLFNIFCCIYRISSFISLDLCEVQLQQRHDISCW